MARPSRTWCISLLKCWQKPRENYQFSKNFDNARARADLHFTYTVTWKEGVRRMVNWLDERGQIDNSDLDPYEDRVIAAWKGVEKSMLYAGLV